MMASRTSDYLSEKLGSYESHCSISSEDVESCETLLEQSAKIAKKTTTTLRTVKSFIGFQITLLCLYTFLAWTAVSMIVQRQLRGGEHASSGPFGPDLIASPARSVVRYEAVEFDNLLLGTSPFRGPMRPEQDEAWDILLEDQNIIVQEEDLIKVNRTSLKMYDGSGYLAALDVYHELHCLNYIRKYIHRDYYANDELPETQIVHVGHCIDTLRMTLMCHADISLVTYDWLPNLSAPWPNFNNEHECRNWDSIEKYAKEHTIGANNPTGPWMKNPYTGKFWPEPEKGAGSG